MLIRVYVSNKIKRKRKRSPGTTLGLYTNFLKGNGPKSLKDFLIAPPPAFRFDFRDGAHWVLSLSFLQP